MAIKKAKLSAKKQKWVDKTKPTAAIRGKTLNPSVKAQREYQRRLDKLVARMIEETEREFLKLFESKETNKFFAEDASISSQAEILSDKLTKKFDRLFAMQAEPITEQMIKAENKQSISTLGSSLKELSGGLIIKTDVMSSELKEIIKASSNESTKLIKSIASQYQEEVQGAVMRSITTGNGLKDLVPFFEKRAGMTKRRAKNIALDQTRKVYNSINQGRMEALGVKTYEWVHSGGGKEPREHHIKRFPEGLNGGIFSFDDPPIIDEKTGQRGKPGELINCRCTMRPVFKFEDGEKVDE